MPGADERNDARLGALHEEVVHLRDRLQEQAEEVAVMRSEINGLAGLPAAFTEMRVEVAALKGRLVMVGLVVALLVPAATAVLVRFIR